MRLLSPILVASTLLPLISAVPAGSSITPPPPLLPSHLTQSNPRPWARLRDWVIGSIWDIDHKRCPSKYSSPPSDIHDRYGSDVVLRFHLRQPDEAEALAAASQVLFLDIWAITSKFVDIRLADDMVNFSSDRFMIVSLIILLDPFLVGHTTFNTPHLLHSPHRQPRRRDIRLLPLPPPYRLRLQFRNCIG